MKLYSIKDWATCYETHETKKLVALRWVPIPNKHDGLTFRQIGQEKRAADLFAAWVLMVQLASKSDKNHRGQLVRNGRPMSARDMSITTGFPESIFSAALAYFSQESVGWIIAEDFNLELPLSPGEPGESPGEPGLSPENLPLNGREWKEGNGRKEVGRAAVAAPTSDSEWLAELQTNPAYNGISVATEFAKMRAWCSANKKQPTRRRFVNWLNRAEKPMQTTAAYRPVVQDGPPNWRASLARLRPGNTYDGSWSALPESLKKEIAA